MCFMHLKSFSTFSSLLQFSVVGHETKKLNKTNLKIHLPIIIIDGETHESESCG